MPQTLRESGDPEAAAAVFGREVGGGDGVCGGCNGLHMSPSLLERARRDRLAIFICWLLLSLIIRPGKLSRRQSSSGGSQGALAVRLWWRGGMMEGQIFDVVLSLLQNRFQKRARVVQVASKLLMPCYRFWVHVRVCDPDITSPHRQPHTYAYTESDNATDVLK